MNSSAKTRHSGKSALSTSDHWDLRLYVAGQTPRSIAAIANLKKICEAHLKGKYRIQVIDLLANPQLSREHQIIAIPTLVRKLPVPIRKLIGDFSDATRTLVGLQLRDPASRDVHPHGGHP